MEEKNQVVNYLQSNFLGKGFQELRDQVINNQNCVLCGTCTSICPRIGLDETEPTLIEYDPECSTCFRYCPQTYFPDEMFEKELFPENVTTSFTLGSYQKLIAARSKDETVLRTAQNGGVVSSLLIHDFQYLQSFLQEFQFLHVSLFFFLLPFYFIALSKNSSPDNMIFNLLSFISIIDII